MSSSNGSSIDLAMVDMDPFYRHYTPDQEPSTFHPDLNKCIQQLTRACEEIGFFYVTGHRVNREIRDKVLKSSKGFFALSEEDKNKVACPGSIHPRGFSKFKNENVSSFMGKNGGPDPVEKFSIGMLDVPSDPRCEADDTKALFAPNVWPSDSLLPNFRENVENYFTAVNSLSNDILVLICLALKIDWKFFHAHTNIAPNSLRLLHYPPLKLSQAPANVQPSIDPFDDTLVGNNLRMAAHTDLGTVTVLMQDELGGLQVRVKDEWKDVKWKEDTLVVNIGDVLMQWTNDRFRSTIHRVVALNSPSNDLEVSPSRYSFIYFGSVNFDAVIENLIKDSKSKYPATSWKVYLAKKMEAMNTSTKFSHSKPLQY